MKKMIYMLTMLIPVLLTGQNFGDIGITYTLANGLITSSSGSSYYEFDVMAQADEESTPHTRLGTGIVYLDYSAGPFGSYIYNQTTPANSTVRVTKGALLSTTFVDGDAVAAYGIILNNTNANRLAITFEFLELDALQAYGNDLLVTPQVLVHVKILIIDVNSAIHICFFQDSMLTETFYDDESTRYDPVVANMCLYQDPPLPVELSYFSCVMSNTNAAVNLTWVTQTETNMVGFRVIRGESNVLEEAVDQGVLVAATNTSNENVYYWSDTEIISDHTYNYWLEAQDMDGTSQFYGPTSITTPSQNINAPNIPLVTGLTSVYPNPFNPDLTIHYTLERSCPVQIYITNIRGQIVKELVNAAKDRGTYKFIWDGTDSSGRPCSSGVFYIKMLAGGKEYNKKAVLLK